MGYNKGLAIFIDILGTKGRSFDELYRINKIFHKELNKEKKPFWDKIKKHVSSFSDCAYIVYEFSDNVLHDNIEVAGLIEMSLRDLTLTITCFAFNGFLCRGGVAYGDLFFDKENSVLFGPAINEAYLLETKAIMPRIIFSETLINDLFIKDKPLYLDGITFTDNYDKHPFFNYLYGIMTVDLDEIINATNNQMFLLSNEPYSFKEICETIKQYSKNVIDTSSDHKILAKHLWQLNYINLVDTSYKNTVEYFSKHIKK